MCPTKLQGNLGVDILAPGHIPSAFEKKERAAQSLADNLEPEDVAWTMWFGNSTASFFWLPYRVEAYDKVNNDN